jgi:RimJ/RimL family protein N-acetyltransferase
MNENAFCGKFVRLVAFEPEKHAFLSANWTRDSEFSRLLNAEPAYLLTENQVKAWAEKQHDLYQFVILDHQNDRPIGLVELDGVSWTAGDAFVGIGLGERDYWGKGYGTEAMNIILGYAFRELGLRRVSLTVFEYNLRAIHSYEKIGFTHEGRLRQALNRDGKRWDILFMGILRAEWEAKQLGEK